MQVIKKNNKTLDNKGKVKFGRLRWAGYKWINFVLHHFS